MVVLQKSFFFTTLSIRGNIATSPASNICLMLGSSCNAPATHRFHWIRRFLGNRFGTGLVGGEFLEQIEATRDQLAKQGLDVTVAAISKTKPNEDGERQPWMLCDDEDGCTLEDVEAGLADPNAGEAGDFMKMASFLKSCSSNAVIVDATASEAVSDYYPKWLAEGVHVRLLVSIWGPLGWMPGLQPMCSACYT